MYLRYRCAACGFRVYAAEHFGNGFAQIGFDQSIDFRRRYRRDVALQLFELFNPLRPENIDPRGQYLTEFNEGRTQLLKRFAEASRRTHITAVGMHFVPARRAQTDALHKAAQAVFRQHGNNFAHSGKVAHSEQSRYHHWSGIFAKFFINNALTQYNRRFFAKHPVFYIQSPAYPRYRIT